ncbi:hypothetical protein BKA67DRAFT_503388, partial [Truncatella angustata]
VQQGTKVETMWSSNVVVSSIICTFQSSQFTFYGILGQNSDRSFEHWQVSDELLWIYDTGATVSVWQESQQRPNAAEGFVGYEIENIIGHYEFDNGRLFYAVKWSGYNCPTWE